MADDQATLNLPLPEPPPPPPPLVDLSGLVGVVAKRHGVMMKKDDPAFILVTLLEEVSKAHMARLAAELETAMDGITASSEEQKEAAKSIAERIVNEGGAHIARRIETAGLTMAPAIVSAVLAGLGPMLDAVNAKAAEQAVAAKKSKRTAIAAAVVAVLSMVASAGLYAGSLAA
jgi:hypothetical protein